jgi:hypothetical protein
MELRGRRLLLVSVTEHPDAERVIQQLRNLAVEHDHLPRFILHDRDGKFSEEFDSFAEASGTKIIKLAARSPNQRLRGTLGAQRARRMPGPDHGSLFILLLIRHLLSQAREIEDDAPFLG